MRLAIVNLTRTGISGGAHKYLREMLPRLARHPVVSDLEVFIHPKFLDQICHLVPQSRCRPCEDSLRGQRRLRKALIRLAPDLIFFPHLRGIDSDGTPSIFMIHNMEPLALPAGGNTHRETLKNLARKYAAKSACRRASRILAVSQFVKDFLVNTWHISPGKIGVVYHGSDDLLTNYIPMRPKAIPSDWEEGFLFTAGSIRPSRGLEDIIKALPELAAAGNALPLVIAGTADASSYPYERRLKRLIEKLGVQDRVIWTGHLATEEMLWCYSQASLFIMTSRVEACPNIALEAMSSGSGCIAADNKPLPEFFRDAALYYRPGDSNSLAEAITFFQNSSLRFQGEMRGRARTRAADFTWDKTAEETVKQLQLTLDAKNDEEPKSDY